MSEKNLSYYLDQYAQGKATPEEKSMLARLLDDPERKDELNQVLSTHWALWEKTTLDFPNIYSRVEQGIAAQIKADIEKEANLVVPNRQVHILRSSRFRYAAAVVFILMLGAIAFFTLTSRNQASKGISLTGPVKTDIVPGSNKAVLILADGTTITLDQAAEGHLAQQGNAQVVKSPNGAITYNVKGNSTGEVLMNTMRTPRGGQYQLVLPDGTRVWLNAASSITYPAVFSDNERKIKVSGEVYLEVTKYREKPFIVDVDGKSQIQVLGTHFNIKAYKDEGVISTTLLEGSIKVSNSIGAPAVLSPGQQAWSAMDQQTPVKVENAADLDQVVAWKNGFFNFNKVDLQTAMRELGRWYDVDIVYEGKIPDIQFLGKIQRSLDLSDLLYGLKRTDVHFRIEGKKIIVMP